MVEEFDHQDKSLENVGKYNLPYITFNIQFDQYNDNSEYQINQIFKIKIPLINQTYIKITLLIKYIIQETIKIIKNIQLKKNLKNYQKFLKKRRRKINLIGNQNQVNNKSVNKNKKQKKQNKIFIFLSIFLGAVLQFSGVGPVNSYIYYFIQIILPQQTSILSFVATVQVFIFNIFTKFILSCIGRKTALSLGLLLTIISHSLLAIGLFLLVPTTQGQNEPLFQLNNIGACVFILARLFFFGVSFGMLVGPIIWLYIPQFTQSYIIPYSVMVNWFFSALLPTIFPIIRDALLIKMQLLFLLCQLFQIQYPLQQLNGQEYKLQIDLMHKQRNKWIIFNYGKQKSKYEYLLIKTWLNNIHNTSIFKTVILFEIIIYQF